jgi:hypothetical protein
MELDVDGFIKLQAKRVTERKNFSLETNSQQLFIVEKQIICILFKSQKSYVLPILYISLSPAKKEQLEESAILLLISGYF